MSAESSTVSRITNPGWGIVSGTLWAFIAFMGPQFLIGFLIPAVEKLGIGGNTELFVLEGLTELIIFAVIVCVIKLYGSTLGDIGLHTKLRARDLGLVLLCFPLYVLTSGVLTEVMSKLFPQLDLLAKQQVGFQKGSVFEMVLVFVALVLIPPFVEEVVFRGFLLNPYRRTFGLWWSTALVSFLFAVAHTPIAASIDVFALSLYLCYVRNKTGSLWASVALHSIKNLVAFVFLFIMPTR